MNMNEREAIDCFELIKCGLSLEKEVSEKMINLATTALKKQIAKKPIICGENPDGTYQFKCPECGRLWWEKSYITKYCDKCGNLIDRSEEE